MTFQVATVAKPVGFVQRICAAGRKVVFDSEGSYIVNKQTGELNWLRKDNGNFMLDVWVPPPAAVDPCVMGKREAPFPEAAVARVNRRTDGVRPHFNFSGERGFSEQGVYGMDLLDAGNDYEVFRV